MKKINNFFGIVSKKEGAEMLKDLNKIKSKEIKLLRKKINNLKI